MKCPKCGGKEIEEMVIEQDRMGNDLHGLVCMNCDHVVDQQDSAGQCLHLNYETDAIQRMWCIECGEYLGER